VSPAGGARNRRPAANGKKLWVHTVTTVSTFPREGLFTKDARTIARALASKRVSPKGPTSGLRMLLFFINRAGHGLTRSRRAELEKAKRLLQEKVAGRQKAG
jgi:tRNA(adenine34) deaminase